MSKVLASRNVKIGLTKHILKCCIWSLVPYGAETWKFTKATINKLEAFEMWNYRRMLRISWAEHKSNEQVLNMMNF